MAQTEASGNPQEADTCKKFDFQLQPEDDYFFLIHRYIAKGFLPPVDPVTNRPFCAKYFIRGVCKIGCNKSHHQSISDESVAALTSYVLRARAWLKVNPPPPRRRSRGTAATTPQAAKTREGRGGAHRDQGTSTWNPFCWNTVLRDIP